MVQQRRQIQSLAGTSKHNCQKYVVRFSNVVVGGGFSLAYENFGERFDGSFPAEVFFFFFKWKSTSRTPIPLIRPALLHSGSAS